MPIDELPRHEKVFPIVLEKMVVESKLNGWPKEKVLIVENRNK
jgi:hypothetical protein